MSLRTLVAIEAEMDAIKANNPNWASSEIDKTLYAKLLKEKNQLTQQAPPSDDENTCSLFTELKKAKVDNDEFGLGKVIKLDNSICFPCEPVKRFGNLLILRDAIEDIWSIVNTHLVTKNKLTEREISLSGGFMVIGSVGAGTTWCSMRVLVGLIQANKTVVYHSAQRDMTWIFRNDGRCSCYHFINYNIPELSNHDSFHIFDAKAGEVCLPPRRDATLLFFSSNLEASYKLTSRRTDVKQLVFPCATEDEFKRHGKIFGKSEDVVRYIGGKYGFGNIRFLHYDLIALDVLVQRAIDTFDHHQLLIYATLPSTMAEANPSFLVGAKLKEPYTPDLLTRYSFATAEWVLISNEVRDRLLETYQSEAPEILVKIFMSVKRAEYLQILGVPAGKMFEVITPHCIQKNGLTYQEFGSQESFSIPKDLEIIYMDPLGDDIERLQTTCSNPKTLYVFNANQHLFDAFFPPNTLIQFASTLQKKGRHEMLLSTALKCCEKFPNNKVDFIVLVPNEDRAKWKPLPFAVNVDSVVKAINKETQGNGMKSGHSRPFNELDNGSQQMLKNFKQYQGWLQIRRYSTMRTGNKYPQSTSLFLGARGLRRVVAMFK